MLEMDGETKFNTTIIRFEKNSNYFFFVSDGHSDLKTDDPNFNRSYVKKKLEHGLSRIWQVCTTYFCFIFEVSGNFLFKNTISHFSF